LRPGPWQFLNLAKEGGREPRPKALGVPVPDEKSAVAPAGGVFPGYTIRSALMEDAGDLPELSPRVVALTGATLAVGRSLQDRGRGPQARATETVAQRARDAEVGVREALRRHAEGVEDLRKARRDLSDMCAADPQDTAAIMVRVAGSCLPLPPPAHPLGCEVRRLHVMYGR